MAALTIRLPDSIHRKVKELAARDGISVNQFMASATAEKLASWPTLEPLRAEAAQGRRGPCTSQAPRKHLAGTLQAGLPGMQAGRAPAASARLTSGRWL